MKRAYNAGRKGRPVATFRTIDKFEGLKIKARPFGARGWRLFWRFPIFERIPYTYDARLAFWLIVECEKHLPEDYREIEIAVSRGGRQEVPEKRLTLESGKSRLKKPMELKGYHDGEQIIVNVRFPQKSKTEQLIISNPVPANTLFMGVVGVAVSVIVTAILAWLAGFASGLLINLIDYVAGSL